MQLLKLIADSLKSFFGKLRNIFPGSLDDSSDAHRVLPRRTPHFTLLYYSKIFINYREDGEYRQNMGPTKWSPRAEFKSD